MTLTFLRARLADIRAELEQLNQNAFVRLGATRRNPAGRRADVRTIQIEPHATGQHFDRIF
jgi:hypothetical protein